MTPIRPLLVAAAATATILAACTGPPARPAAVSCPPERRDQVVLVGLSASGRDPRLLEGRRAELRRALAVAGDCGGALVVRAWSTAGAVQTLWGGGDRLEVPGATESGRDRRLGRAVDEALATIDTRLATALERLPAQGSDFLAWADLAADAVAELGGRRPVVVTVLDDGVQSAEPDLNQPISVERATALAAEHAPGAGLGGVEVTLVGVGQVAGPPPPAGGTWVAAVQAFAQETCAATGATCTVLSAPDRAG